jgi:tetratricopeptide (TPR) repeat protein
MAAVAAAVVLLIAAGSGYATGLTAAEATRSGASASAVDEQFNLGVEDLLAGRYDLARQRFEYVLSIEPANPDAAELLERARAALFVPTSTPGPTPTPITPTPTLDVASLDGLFEQAQGAFAQGDWGRVLEASLLIRARDPQHRRAEINTLLAQALRSRGVQRILSGDFELGIYDLALAERFGPLDGGAVAWRNSAAFYTFANSFFVVDWIRAVENFRQLCVADLWDSCSKYARAALEYGHILLASGTPCAASTQYAISLDIRSNPALEPTADYAADRCATQMARQHRDDLADVDARAVGDRRPHGCRYRDADPSDGSDRYPKRHAGAVRDPVAD